MTIFKKTLITLLFIVASNALINASNWPSLHEIAAKCQTRMNKLSAEFAAGLMELHLQYNNNNTELNMSLTQNTNQSNSPNEELTFKELKQSHNNNVKRKKSILNSKLKKAKFFKYSSLSLPSFFTLLILNSIKSKKKINPLILGSLGISSLLYLKKAQDEKNIKKKINKCDPHFSDNYKYANFLEETAKKALSEHANLLEETKNKKTEYAINTLIKYAKSDVKLAQKIKQNIEKTKKEINKTYNKNTDIEFEHWTTNNQYLKNSKLIEKKDADCIEYELFLNRNRFEQ